MTTPPPIKFLLVDDLESNLLALSGLLQREGLELLTARSGPDALELLLVHEFALAFIDVQMPEMSGFELAETMRSTERTREVPIIFLTAGAVDSQHRIRGYETGAVDFLTKPIDPHNLLNKAATFFQLARQRQELAWSNARLAEADRSKNEFLAMLAHELRNPLAPLRNAAELLEMPEASAEERTESRRILTRQIENMSRMIDDLLDVSRITEGKISLHKEPVALAAILTAATNLTRSACIARQQQLVLELPTEPVFLTADATRLEQVFGNLLSNASKYSGDRSKITVSAKRTSSREAAISVHDDGVGIAPELLPRVFELFVQASRTLDRAHGGLGIGLTLVQRLVHLHGGSVEARSEGLGHGAEFIVRLPVMISAPSMPAPVTSASLEEPRRILIVDDNTDSAHSLARLQARRGHVTRTAFTGPDALAAAEFLPEIVLLDIGLPGMDGFEVARHMKGLSSLRGVFIIAMSGYGSDEDRVKAKAAGFDEYMVKPVNLEELHKHLRARV